MSWAKSQKMMVDLLPYITVRPFKLNHYKCHQDKQNQKTIKPFNFEM